MDIVDNNAIFGLTINNNIKVKNEGEFGEDNVPSLIKKEILKKN